MRLGDVLKTVPNAVWFCVTAVILGILASFVVLSLQGADATELRTFLNTLVNFGALLFGGIGAVAGSAAAINSKQAADQTNGPINEIQRAVTEIQQVQHTDSVQYNADQGRNING